MSADDRLRRLERRIVRQLDVRLALGRVWESLPAIAQIIAAVAAAYAIAHWGLGHAAPILAITVTINSLGFSRDARPRRVAERVLGIVLGVALADVLGMLLGSGVWQLLVVLTAVLVVGRLVSPNPAFAVAAALPSAIVTLLPAPEGPWGRTIDAAIAGAVALVVTALIPRDVGGQTARDRAAVFSVLVESADDVRRALADAEPAAAELALSRLRRSDDLLQAWRTSLDSATAVARISPFLRGRLPELRRDAAALDAADLAIRHLRTLSRRVEFLVRDGVPRPAIADLVDGVGTGIRLLGEELRDPMATGAARSLLSDVARRLDPATAVPGAPLRDAAVVLLLRPFVVDVLHGTGLPLDDARALLPVVRD